jgi:predicted RNase H-like HicB family nuclease
MQNTYKLEYWSDGDWLVGRLRGIPGVFSQGKSLEELIENVQDAYRMMVKSEAPAPVNVEANYVEIELAV